jgi:hypothetical protein
MMPGQAGRRQGEDAQRAVWQGQQQAQQQQLLQQQRLRRQRKRERQAREAAAFVADGNDGTPAELQYLPASPPIRRGRVARWSSAIALLAWAVAIATHVEWVRLHDGPVTPVSYAIPVVITVLVAALLLSRYALSARQQSRSAAEVERASVRPAKERPVPAAPLIAQPRPQASGGDMTAQYPVHMARAAPVLLVISDPGQHRQIPIPPGGIVLGRREHLGPPFSTDELLSREHASIRPHHDGSVEVTDLGSTNGTFVNAVKVAGPTRMGAGDVLRVGSIDLRLSAATVPGRQTAGTAAAEAAAAGDPSDQSIPFYVPEPTDDDSASGPV